MEYVYCSPAKRRKLSHANDSFTHHFDLENQSQNNKIVIQELPPQIVGSIGDDDGVFHSRKKLLVLDVNGLLVDIVADPDQAHRPDTTIASKAVFKRPFCDEFLKFCFERFSVGVWTSRTRRNIKQVLDFLMTDTQHQLLFCWDQSHCTETGFNTIENPGKPLLLKELKTLWEKQDSNLPWDRGVYDESNTLLLDDSPYKALRNPPYTAIFPYTYSYRNAQDNGLGPNGDLRNYLERLAASDNVQKFIEQNPFGQPPITHANESWNFYRKIICSTQPGAGPTRSRKKLIVIDIAGLLVDVVTAPREGFRADTVHGSRAVFRRPYCDEFLRFCFKTFNVGVWTSTPRYSMERALDFLMRDTQHRLLFCWDVDHCTDTGFVTVENDCKKLRLKEIRKLWEKKDPNLPWEIGEYDESNTLLVDNAPHRALLNPPHTAIFPYSYRHWDTEDNSLGPKGDLRIYLERLAASENVQKFVSENPFGQRPIREKNLSWGFYQKVIRAFSYKRKAGDSVDAQCKNPSEPKPDTTIASVTKTLPEPKTDSSASLAASDLLEPRPNSTTTSAAHTLVEPETDIVTASAAQTLVEPETKTITILTAPTLLEPETGATIALGGQTVSEPEIDTTALAALAALAVQTLLEPETCTSDDAPPPGFTTSSKGALTTDVDNVTVCIALSAKNKSRSPKRSESNSAVNGSVTCSSNKRFMNSVEDNSCVKRFQSSAGSKGNTQVTASDMGTSGSDDIHQDSPSVEHGIIMTQTSGAEDAKNYKKRKGGRPPKSMGLKESNSALDGSVTCSRNKNVVNSCGKRLRSSAGSKGNTKVIASVLETSGSNHQDSPPLENHDIIITQTGEAEDGKSHKERNTRRPPKLVDLKKTSGADDDNARPKRRGRPPKSVVKNPIGLQEGSSCLSPPDHHDKSLNQAIVTTKSSVSCLHQETNFNEFKKQTVEAGNDKSHQKKKRGRPPKSVDLKQTGEAEDGQSHQKRKTRKPPKVVDLKKTSGADDGRSCQKRKRGRPPKLVKKPIGLLEGTTDLDEQPLSVWYEEMHQLSVLKKNSCLTPRGHGNKSPNQAIVTTAGTTNDYQQDWPFIKMCPIWAPIESLVLRLTPPQKPHFSPLKNTNEFYREGLAIAHMVTYWKLVHMLSRLKANDPVYIIYNSLEALVDLETHGFDVEAMRRRLKELLCLKSKAGQHEDTLKELEMCNHEKLDMRKETDRLKVEIQKLQEKLVQVETMQKVKEEEIVRLQSNLAHVSNQTNDWELAFEKLVATPL